MTHFDRKKSALLHLWMHASKSVILNKRDASISRCMHRCITRYKTRK